MKTILKGKKGFRKAITITTDRAESSYGIPVAVCDGIAYGVRDQIPCWIDDETPWMIEEARQTVAALALEQGKLDHPLIKKFIHQPF